MTARAGVAPPRGVGVKAFAIVMVDGYDTLMIAFVAPLLARQWGMSPVDLGKLFAIGYLGAVIGSMAMGPLADRIGRKPMLVGAMLLAGIATMACAQAGSLHTLMALRFVAGLGLGGALPAAIALTAEHARSGRRGGTVTLMYLGYPLGAVLGGAVTAALLHLGAAAIFMGAGVMGLLAASIAGTLPAETRTERGPRRLFTEQFAEGRLLPALLLWLGLFCTLLLTYFLLSWTPQLIVASGGSPRLAALGPVLLNLGGIVGALLAAPVIDRIGPYRPNALLALAGGVLVALLGQGFASLPLTLAGLFLTGVGVLGAQLSFPAMAVDLFPARVRSAGAGSTAGFGRLGSIAGPLIGGVLIGAGLGTPRLFAIAAVPALVAALSLAMAGRLRRRLSFGDSA